MREIILVGYGNQGRAWAHNLRDSGWSVWVSGRSADQGGQGIRRAQSDGFLTLQLAEIAEKSSPVAFLLPDETIPVVYRNYFALDTQLPGRALLFAHGFSVVYGKLAFGPNDDVILVAPKGIGTKLRERYVAGSGVLGVLGVEQDASGKAWALGRSVAEGLGCARVGILETTFAQETNADLLSEQVILCGLLPRLIQSCVDFLVERGIPPRLATFECLHETQLMTEMMASYGINGMFERVSRTAKFGGLRAAERILPQEILDKAMAQLWQEIIQGNFAAELAQEIAGGSPRMERALRPYRASSVDANL